MTRYHAVFNKAGERIYEVQDGVVTIDLRGERPREAGYYVMPDIQPYRSQISGEVIQSRSAHRTHLRNNGCIEVGNETKHLKPKPVTTPPGLKQRLIEVANSKL